MLSFGLFHVAQGAIVRLESLDLSAFEQGYERPHKNRSVDRNPLKIGNETFEHGIGTHARSDVRIKTAGLATRFSAKVGVDAETGKRGSVQFLVLADGKRVYDSGKMRGGEAAKTVDVDITGAKVVRLIVEDGGDGMDYDHADWAEAVFTTSSPDAKLVALVAPKEPGMAIYHGFPAKPEFNGPKIIGATPGCDFIFRVPVTGQGTIVVTVKNLPSGLTFDPVRHVIKGKAPKEGTYTINLTAKSSKGTATRAIKLVTGFHKLALTPALGWNSWNVWGLDVDAEKVRAAADSFVSSGLADAGYGFVNIDDGWEAGRTPEGEILANKKFGDMEALSSYVHSLGLKLGIYSSPGPKTCGGYEGSYNHEEQDAATYAKWGIDYLKYDWCSYGGIERGNTLEGYKKPYIHMRNALDAAKRDIVYSLCQYGMGDVYKWGKEIGANSWRTTGDINDSWSSMAGIGFGQDKQSAFASPGGWNDPDMLVVGKLGWSRNIRDTRLTQNEQITHISLWSLLSSPMMIGCDLTKLDTFTKDVLMNHEILEVHQDSLGKTARLVKKDGEMEIWARPLEDGSFAVGFFNRGLEKAPVNFKLSEIGINWKSVKVRNLWTRKDISLPANRSGSASSKSVVVPGHGAQVYRFMRAK